MLRLGAAALIGVYSLTYRAHPGHPAPAYVRPAAVALAAVVAVLATAQLRWRTSRALALASVVVDAGVAAGLLWLYGFDPRRFLFALVIPVQAEATLILGLPGGAAVWAAMGASYAMEEALAGPLYGIPTDAAAVAVRLAAGLFVVLVTATLFQGLAAEHRRFTALFQAAPDAIVVADASGRIVLVNGRAEAMLGYGRGELVGKPVEVLIPDRFREAHQRHWAAYAKAPRVRSLGKELELAALRKDGTEVPVEIGFSFVEERIGLLVTSIIRDVTEERNAEKELRESHETLQRTNEQRRKLMSLLVDAQEAERRRLADDIHDDTIQKMAAVGMRLEAMKAQLPEELRESVDSVSRTVSLAVERLRYLMFELHPPALDRAGLEVALREHLGETSEASRLSFSLDSRLVDEPSQETRTVAYRIVQEALANVRKHARANHVEVLLEPRDGGLFVAVRDDGVGFSPSEVGEPQPGHLGLQSMRERAELAGGWVRVASDPGRGTTVEFWLPAADPTRGAG